MPDHQDTRIFVEKEAKKAAIGKLWTMDVWPKRMVPNLSFCWGTRPIDQKGTFLIWGWYDILDRNSCCHVPYVAAQRRPASALTSKPQRNYVLALKWSALRCLKNDMMHTFDWVWEYIGRRLMKVNPRSKFKANVMLFRVADLNWIQLVQWIQIGKGLIIPTWSYVLRLENAFSQTYIIGQHHAQPQPSTWWWYLQARCFYLQAAECVCFFSKGLRTEVEICQTAFLSSFLFWDDRWKKTLEMECLQLRDANEMMKKIGKSSKGLTWSCRRTRAMSLPVFKTSQISVRRLVVLFFLLTVLVVSLWIFFVASCMPRSSQRDRRSHSTRSLLSMDLLRSFACCKLSHDWQQRRNACGSLH